MAAHKRRFPRLLEQIFSITPWVPSLRPGFAVPGDAAAPNPAEPGHRPEHTEPGRIRRSLHASTTDGIFAEVMVAFTQGSVLTAWGLFVGGDTFFIGLLASMLYLAQAFHLPAAWITAHFGRRRVCIWSTAISRQLFWILVPLPLLDLAPGVMQAMVLGVAFLSAVLGVVGSNAWISWMGDLVPEQLRGRYFGRRNAFATMGGTVAAFVAGVTLDGFAGNGTIGRALALLGAASCIAGAITTYNLWRQHEPRPHAAKDEVNVRATFRPFFDPAARPFLKYQATWNVSVALAAAYIPVHMIQNLHMDFVLIALHAACLALFRVIASPLWGKVMDRVGPRPVLILCSFGIASLPFIWLFPTETMLWPIILDALISGTLWAGHAVALFALPFQIAPRQGRPFYLAAFTATGGICFALSCTAAGALANWLPANFVLFGQPWVNIHVLFFISFFARLFAAMLALRLAISDSAPVTEAMRQFAGEGLTDLKSRAARLASPLLRR